MLAFFVKRFGLSQNSTGSPSLSPKSDGNSHISSDRGRFGTAGDVIESPGICRLLKATRAVNLRNSTTLYRFQRFRKKEKDQKIRFVGMATGQKNAVLKSALEILRQGDVCKEEREMRIAQLFKV